MSRKATTIFSIKEHIASIKKHTRIKKAKFFGYHLSKLLIVSVICLSLIVAGTYQVSAGYKVKKSRVSANATAGSFQTSSNSRANVSNNNSVRINSSAGGGYRPAISRNNNGHNNRNNHHRANGRNKKVVKKVIRKNIDVDITKNIDIDKTIVHKDITINKPHYNYCPDDCYETSSSYPNTNTNYNYNYNVNKNYNKNSSTSEIYHYHPGY